LRKSDWIKIILPRLNSTQHNIAFSLTFLKYAVFWYVRSYSITDKVFINSCKNKTCGCAIKVKFVGDRGT